MQESQFNLIGIFRAIFTKKKFVLLFTLAAFIVSLIFCLLQQERYTSKTIFIVKNPLLIDRNYVFRNTSYEHKEFFAIPDDIDHVTTIAKSDGLLWHLIEKFDLSKAYGIENGPKLLKTVKNNFKFKNEDAKNIELFYTDPNPKKAQEITIEARNHVEEVFLNYFLSTNSDITSALHKKSLMVQDTIRMLDDSIKSIRAQVGNYTQLLPSRNNSINTAAAAGSAQNAESLEQLQEITALKDKMVGDLTEYKSLINEYQVMASSDIRLFYVVQEAYEPGDASHPMTIIIVAASTLAALLFASILVLFTVFYRNVMGSKSQTA